MEHVLAVCGLLVHAGDGRKARKGECRAVPEAGRPDRRHFENLQRHPDAVLLKRADLRTIVLAPEREALLCARRGLELLDAARDLRDAGTAGERIAVREVVARDAPEVLEC